ncbi:MAG: response regulator [Deltaproteobacteria bacterium]|nr:response regulator [Deltaproteobacteria bacterium]
MAALRILLVDDELDFIEPLARRMERRGMQCVALQDGEKALALIQTERFNCVVLDVRMPGIDGIEVLRRIRRDHPDLPVVLLTGHASVELGVRGMQLGAFEYLLKPIDLDDLLDTVRRAADHALAGA